MKRSVKYFFIVIFLLNTVFFNINGANAVYGAEVSQSTEITVLVDNVPVVFDQQPLLISNRVMVPLRAVAEAMGWEVRVNNNVTVIELAKSVKYTDGYRNYLFSSHTVTIDLEHHTMGRSIMIGVGHFFDKTEDHGISFTVEPVIVNGRTLISVRDLAECLYADVDWDGANKTVIITSGEIPYYDGHGLASRDELFEEMRVYNKVSGALTKVGESSSPVITADFHPAGVITSVPEVGSVPSNILLSGKTDVKSADSYYEPYKNNISSGCNWYVYGRLYETTGIWVPNVYQFGTRGGLKDVEAANLDYVKVERDVNKVVAGCVGIFVGKAENDTGHSIFVEYVEYNSKGKPVTVYYTDSNHSYTGYYDPQKDAKIIKVSFEKFSSSLYQTKVFDGYIIPAQ